MPVTVEISPAARLVLTTFTGPASEADMRSVTALILQNPEFDPSFSHIINLGGVTVANVSTNFLRTLAQQKPVFHRDARQLIVAPQSHLFGLARMTQMLREQLLPNIQVVQTMEEAYSLVRIKPIR